ncbi:MAG: magnesium-translocating P-type ATPase [Anaerolineae bacterium]
MKRSELGSVDAVDWSLDAAAQLRRLATAAAGLSIAEAARRLAAHGPNTLQSHHRANALTLFLRQLRSPMVLILLAATIVSAAVNEPVDAAIILLIILGSAGLGFYQEYRAEGGVRELLARVTLTTTALRDGKSVRLPAANLVPGDIVLLSAGSLVPADGIVIESLDCNVDEAALTGETFPVLKGPTPVPADTPLAGRTNAVFMGTSVRSGSATVVVVATGAATAFGGIAARLDERTPETDFARGIRRFGLLLSQTMLVLVTIVFAINVALHRPALEALLFSVALAVGLTPQLLPAIVSVNVASGAKRMAEAGVIVRRLEAIQNLGSMDVLCTDKTGTLTEGTVKLAGACDAGGQPSDTVAAAAWQNAKLQTGLPNPLDEAILQSAPPAAGDAVKLGEIPYDFSRRRLSVVVATGDTPAGAGGRMITKGALESVLEVCAAVRAADGTAAPLDAAARAGIDALFTGWSGQGSRVLGLASADVPAKPAYARDDERDMVFEGFLLFDDPPKADARAVLDSLEALGVEIKIITGDNRLVAAHVADAVGMAGTSVVTGDELDRLPHAALLRVVDRTAIFAEVDPNQKERLIQALRRTGHVVGYMGDGINDAPSLHAADVAISVDTAVDVAREAADFVLLRRDLSVLRHGIELGRQTFANTIKYIFVTTSANFGNMFSMAFASLFLAFLPLLPAQILLNNFLTDMPALAIARDRVDPELVARPQHWDVRFIRSFMIVFGLISSVFDGLTFGLLIGVLHAAAPEFRTGWFIESALTELVILLVMRTRRPFFRSRPGRVLLGASLGVAAVVVLLPYSPVAANLGFVRLPAPLLAALAELTALYLAANEIAKRLFYGRLGRLGEARAR